MKETRSLNVLKELKGMPLINRATGEKLGDVEDALIHPTQGRVLGLLLKDSGGQRHALDVRDCLIGKDAVMVAEHFHFETPGHGETLSGGVPVGELTGTKAVTEDGRLIGRVSDVYILVDQPRAAYHVTESTMQRFFGGGFFLAGDVPKAYSPDGARLILPSDTENRAAVSSLDEVFAPSQAAT
jgi:uncharacterized protein YrrD